MNSTLMAKATNSADISNYKRYKFLFENSPIPIHETNVNSLAKAIDDLKKIGVKDIERYISTHPEFVSDLFNNSEIFDVNDAMLQMSEADSKAYYIKNFKAVLGTPCFNFFQAMVIALFNGQNSLLGEAEITTFKGRKIWIEATTMFLSMDGEEIINYTFKEITERKRKDQAIQLINKRLVADGSQAHLNNLVAALADAFDLSYVYIGVPTEDDNNIQTLAFIEHQKMQENTTYPLSIAPCLEVYKQNQKIVFPDNLDSLYPDNPTIQDWKGKSYLGYPLRSKKGEIIGHFAFVHEEPIREVKVLQEVMELYASWASTEIENINDKKALKKYSDTIEAQLKGLNNKNQELQRYIESNVQLKNFAYIASHDLKAPIRTIISFLQLIKRDLKGKLTERSQEYMEFISSASQNMRDLIDDLLAYSTIDGQNIKKEPIKIGNILELVTTEMTSSIKEKDAIIKIESLPEFIEGDRTKLKQLFLNLISNAIKFTPEGRQPEVVIDGELQGDYWLFSVQDNGIGIESSYYKQIFELFNKLHSKSDYEGSGLGLAICKKIVEKHNGSIWIKSKVGQGTTFYFTLKK